MIRAARAAEWRKVKELRLTALSDPLAPLAFVTTYAQAAAYSDERWQQYARQSEEGMSTVTLIAEGPDGCWDGSVTALVEPPGEDSPLGAEVLSAQALFVGVYVRPEHRGSGLAGELFRSAIDWSWALAEPRIERIRLFVHEHNERAETFYRKSGFERTGETLPAQDDPAGAKEYELALPRPRPAR